MSEKAAGKASALIEMLVAAQRANPSETGRAVQQAINALHKVIKRAEVPDDMERYSWGATLGPIYEFNGVEIYSDEYTDKDGNVLRLDLAMTEAGKLVVWQERISMGKETSFVDVCDGDDYIGVMNACRWSDMARTMAKKLRWDLRVEID